VRIGYFGESRADTLEEAIENQILRGRVELEIRLAEEQERVMDVLKQLAEYNGGQND
jgi:hypothetical protein